MVEGQPRHDRGVGRCHPVELREVARHELPEVHLKVAVRNHHASRKPGRTRRVLQISHTAGVDRLLTHGDTGIQVQGVDFDDGCCGVGPGFPDILSDEICRPGRGQDDGGSGVGENGADPLVMRAGMRYRQRHGDESRLDRAQETCDVTETLRGQDHRTVPGRPVPPEFLGDIERTPIHL